MERVDRMETFVSLGIMEITALPPPDVVFPGTAAIMSGDDAHVASVVKAEFATPVTEKQDMFAREYATLLNASEAYRRVFNVENQQRQRYANDASRLLKMPHVMARVRKYQREHYETMASEFDTVHRHDLAIIAAYEQITDLVSYVHDACRHCHGIDHKYQWRTLEESTDALTAAIEENETPVLLKKAPKSFPLDDGGYGYTRDAEPVVTCPRCEGSGIQRVVFA